MPKYPRRKFLKQTLKTSIALPLITTSLLSCGGGEKEKPAEEPALKKLKILILGGTSFLGPHQIAYALGRGHTVSTFTRGRTKPTVHQELFKDVEQLIGDRENDLTALENREWDAVIDNSGRNVEWTKNSANLLKDKTDLYMYTSSTGVYYPYLGDNIKEDTELLTEEPEGIEDKDMKIEYWYGVMKTNSELAARAAYGDDRTIVVRPTYMMGPADKTDRFIHWPVRLARGGDVLVPGKTDDPVQYIDVRDVAEWMIRLVEEKKTGTYNAVGPKGPQTMHEFVAEASTAFDAKSNFVKIDDYEFLKAQDIYYIVPWIISEGNNYGSARTSNQRAKDAGLTFRSLKQSMNDVHDWWYSDALTDERRDKFEKKEGSVLMREKELLQAWKVLK